MSTKAHTPLRITVIGGGIGGLAAAILLAQSGHQVTVLEHKTNSFESRSTGGIAIFHNGASIIREMRLGEDLERVSDVGWSIADIKYDTGEVKVRIPKDLPHCMVHRAEVLRIFHERALILGVEVRFGARVQEIIDSFKEPNVLLEDGTKVVSDLVVGADGIESLTRQKLYPDVHPQLSSSVVMLVTISRSAMEASPKTAALWQEQCFQHTLGPGRDIISWAMTKRGVFHLQFCDHEYYDGSKYGFNDTPDLPYIITVTDTSGFRKRWSDFDDGVLHIIDSAESYTKWKIAELPPLHSYHSTPESGGRIVLLGDAAHAIQPFAGMGANMAIEDAQTLATLLSLIWSRDEVADALELYDQQRIPRLASMRALIECNVRSFGLMHEAEREKRDRQLEENAASDDARLKGWKQLAEDMKYWASVKLQDRFDWMERYQPGVEARKAWADWKGAPSSVNDSRL